MTDRGRCHRRNGCDADDVHCGRRDDVHYAILGPLQVEAGGAAVPLGGLRQRSVLALLIVDPRQLVPLGRLVDEVWDDHPPRTAEATVRVYVSRLRRLLAGPGPDAATPLVTRSGGYLLDVDADHVDAGRFERLLAEGRRAHEAGDHCTAGDLLRQALAGWRGPALTDFPQVWARTHATRLEERRQVAVETLMDVDLALGRHAELVGDLAARAAEHPLRERLHAQRMLALYRCGRQADALDAYRQAYDVLAGGRGIDPGGPLRALESAILRQDPSLDWTPPARRPSTPAPIVPAQLPPDIADFTGRDEDLAALEGLARDCDPAPVMAVTAVAGTAGVGKTALAVRWAHRVAGRFPDGQLFLNLRGYDPGRRVHPRVALAQLLHALGVDADRVPATVPEAAALYRSLLADRRVLVVLDNAAAAEQVRPLLPGAGGCLVLVTSRDRLTGLVAQDGARRLTLDVLAPADAVLLVGRVIGADRVLREPDAVAELARLCGYLPLALRIAAANLLDNPYRSIDAHVTALLAGDPLGGLQLGGPGPGPVRLAFDRSYAMLPPEVRRTFRLLGLAPGVDCTVGAAAALADVPAEQAAALLDRLAEAHLVMPIGPGRVTFHDLLRRFAADRAAAEEPEADRVAAAGRLHGWYLTRVRAAARLAYPQTLRLPAPPGEGPPYAGFADRAAALEWLDGERVNLVRTVLHTARAGPWAVAYRLADGLRGYFWIRRHTVDWPTVAEAGLAAATTAGDARARAAAELSLGMAAQSVSSDDAAAHYARARDLSQVARWPEGEAAAINNLSVGSLTAGRLAEAEELLRTSLRINEGTGQVITHATNLSNLGYVYLWLGRLADARDHFTRALILRRGHEDQLSDADIRKGLGRYHHCAGEFDAAHRQLAAALTLCQEVGGLDGEVQVRCALAALHADAGHYPAAVEEARTALQLTDRSGDRQSEALARLRYGDALAGLGRHDEATSAYRAALAQARATSNRHSEIETMIALAGALVGGPDHGQARVLGYRALAAARDCGMRGLEAAALVALAGWELHAGDRDAACAHARLAVTVCQATGHRVAEVRAMLLLGRAADLPEAQSCLQAALDLAVAIGLPEADRIREMKEAGPLITPGAAGVAGAVGLQSPC